MHNMPPEDSLRTTFQTLRSEDRQRTPDVLGMLEKARLEAKASTESIPVAAEVVAARHRLSFRETWPLAAGVLFAAAFAGLMFVGQGEVDEFDAVVMAYSQTRSTGLWSSPTAGLLEVPGMEMIRSMPELGGSLDGTFTSPVY